MPVSAESCLHTSGRRLLFVCMVNNYTIRYQKSEREREREKRALACVTITGTRSNGPVLRPSSIEGETAVFHPRAVQGQLNCDRLCSERKSAANPSMDRRACQLLCFSFHFLSPAVTVSCDRAESFSNVCHLPGEWFAAAVAAAVPVASWGRSE